ncbi:MAG: glucosyltransferase domain-containing protein [Clostridia bacterium]|nr:glucosyltransferase domain-containing protein [Clostridia bacterium]
MSFIVQLQKAWKNQNSRKLFCCAMAGSLFWGLLAHAFVYLNYIPMHDALNYTSRYASGWEIAMGRFGQLIYAKFRSTYSTPWLGGVFSLFFIGAAAFLICDILQLENKPLVFVSSGLLVANATLTDANCSFLYVADTFALAMLLACAGAWVLLKLQGHWAVKAVAASLFFTATMTLYQSYITTAVLLLLFSVMHKAMTQSRLITAEWKNWLGYILSMLLTLIFYFLLFKLFLHHYHVSIANSYNSPANLLTLSFKPLWNSALAVCANVACFFAGVDGSFTLIHALHLALGGAAVILMIRQLRKQKMPLFNWFVVLVGCVACLLVAVLMSIIMKDDSIDFLTSHGLFLLYPAALSLISRAQLRWHRGVRVCALFACICILISNTIFSNEIYTYQKLQYDKTLSHMTRVLYDVNNTPGYVCDQTKVVIIGHSGFAPYIANGPKPEGVQWLRGFTTLSPSDRISFGSYIQNMGEMMNVDSSAETMDVMMAHPAVQAMPHYPINGYCQLVDDTVVVKLLY